MAEDGILIPVVLEGVDTVSSAMASLGESVKATLGGINTEAEKTSKSLNSVVDSLSKASTAKSPVPDLGVKAGFFQGAAEALRDLGVITSEEFSGINRQIEEAYKPLDSVPEKSRRASEGLKSTGEAGVRAFTAASGAVRVFVAAAEGLSITTAVAGVESLATASASLLATAGPLGAALGNVAIAATAIAAATAGVDLAAIAVTSHWADNVRELQDLAGAAGLGVAELYSLKETLNDVEISTQQFSSLIRFSSRTIATTWSDVQKAVRDSSDKIEGDLIRVRDAMRAVDDAMANKSLGAGRTRSAELALEDAQRQLANVKDDLARAEQTAKAADLSALSAHDAYQKAIYERNLKEGTGVRDTNFEKQLEERAEKNRIERLKQADENAQLAVLSAQSSLAAMQSEPEKRQIAVDEAQDRLRRAKEDEAALNDKVTESINNQNAAQRAYMETLSKSPDLVRATLAGEIREDRASPVDPRSIDQAAIKSAVLLEASEKFAGGRTPDTIAMIQAMSEFLNRFPPSPENVGIRQAITSAGGGPGGVSASLQKSLQDLIGVTREQFERNPKYIAEAGRLAADVGPAQEVRQARNDAERAVQDGMNALGRGFSDLATVQIRALGDAIVDLTGQIDKLSGNVDAIKAAYDDPVGFAASKTLEFTRNLIPAPDVPDSFKKQFEQPQNLQGGQNQAVDSFFTKLRNWIFGPSKLDEVASKFDQPAATIADAATKFSTAFVVGEGASVELKNTAAEFNDAMSIFSSAVSEFSSATSNVTYGGPRAGGGIVKGAGTGTSDSIHLMASDGEYVVKSAAVSHWGLPIMEAINSMKMPKFAGGGIIGNIVNFPHFKEGGLVGTEGKHTLDLRTDAGTFQAAVSDDTMRALTRSVMSTKLTSSGVKPSWYK